MKKILYTTIIYFLFTVLFTNVVNANFDDSVDGKQGLNTRDTLGNLGLVCLTERLINMLDR